MDSRLRGSDKYLFCSLFLNFEIFSSHPIDIRTSVLYNRYIPIGDCRKSIRGEGLPPHQMLRSPFANSSMTNAKMTFSAVCIGESFLDNLIMKLLCVLLPHFPWRCETRRMLLPLSKPAIVTYTQGSQKLVADFSPDMEDLLPDMPLQAALARHGDAELLYADIPYYWGTFNRILDELEQVSPMVEGPDPGTIYIGMDGMQLIYPDDNALIAAVKKVVADFAPRLGIASNKFLASLAARYSSGDNCRILNSGDAAAFLKDLPCDILPVSMKSRGKLHNFGLTTLGQVAAMPPAPVYPSSRRKAKGYGSLPAARTIRPSISATWKRISRKASSCPPSPFPWTLSSSLSSRCWAGFSTATLSKAKASAALSSGRRHGTPSTGKRPSISKSRRWMCGIPLPASSACWKIIPSPAPSSRRDCI